MSKTRFRLAAIEEDVHELLGDFKELARVTDARLRSQGISPTEKVWNTLERIEARIGRIEAIVATLIAREPAVVSVDQGSRIDGAGAVDTAGEQRPGEAGGDGPPPLPIPSVGHSVSSVGDYLRGRGRAP